jgi:Cu(I)/Ag(I) efflux system membrane protein CusA/SilA
MTPDEHITPSPAAAEGPPSGWERVLGAFVDNKLVVAIVVVGLVVAGLMTAPFRWDLGGLPRDPTPVDAIPDIGENQQIVFTEWPGRSPRDVEDQITYPLTTALLGIGGVRTVRSFSMFGFSSIYVIFEEGVEFYWSRSRVLEKLASLPAGTVPDGVSPTLGPDATALGQVFWYTLEGRDAAGRLVGGWDLDELRSVQDWTVRYALQAVPGVAEVSSVGGFVKEYQVDVDPEALEAHGVSIDQVARAVSQANLDVGARTMEINRVEYVVRGVGFIRGVGDLEQVVVANRGHTPIRVADVAKVALGPAQRRGALDVDGAPAVGGVVVVRFGENPMAVIERVKTKIEQIAPGLPQRRLADGTTSQVTIVPFYDRTGLIQETLGTLSTALAQQVLITIIVVLLLLRNLKSSLLISAVLPLGILGAFIAMRYTGVDANVMALSGIAIAIGAMVDMGIVFTENVVARLRDAPAGVPRAVVVRRAAAEVAPAVITATLTTVVGFLPIFGLSAGEGKLFRPLAFTKSYAMLAALLIALVVLPAAAHLLLRERPRRGVVSTGWAGVAELVRRRASWVDGLVFGLGALLAAVASPLWGIVFMLLGVARLSEPLWPARLRRHADLVVASIVALAVTVALADYWLPLGPGRGWWRNRLFVAVIVAFLLGSFTLFLRVYPRLLRAALDHKVLTLVGPVAVIAFGLVAWRGFDAWFGWLPQSVRLSSPVVKVAHAFPGFGREYMPPFDEGSFLYMPTIMPHGSIGQAQEQLEAMDAAIASIPEVETAVGKLGRAESPLDPAPISMFETVVSYKSEYRLDERGRRLTFQFDEDRGEFARDEAGGLVPDPDGRPFRQWRDHIRSSDDIWREIQRAAEAPGLTSAPELQPIAARIVMLQSGMRAPMGLKIRGPDLETIEQVAAQIEQLLKKVPTIRPETVVADRIVGKPYLEIAIDREAIARHGISILQVQEVIQIALGGRTLTRTVEGRERYPVRVRYMRERRDTVEAIERVLVPSPLGHQLPLGELADIRYVRGPQVIKAEDTFLTGYVVFDKQPELAEVEVVEQTERFLEAKRKSRDLVLPAGVSYEFAGSYQSQVRSEQRLMVLFPTALVIIFLLIYLQFRRVSTTLIIFSSVALAIAGGFGLIWLYGQSWFLDVAPFGANLRDLFQVSPINMSVAVWVGFIALVGIATDDGVVVSTYLAQRFERGGRPASVATVRHWALEAGVRRARPCLMTSATTILALLPVITSTGKGADVMVPMALPVLGGMLVALLTLFVVPVLYAFVAELELRRRNETNQGQPTDQETLT